MDDLMAIAFLLTRPEIKIEAITVANGLAHVPAGAANILRLLELARRRDIPVYKGREGPLRGDAAFPEVWRTGTDELPGVALPVAPRKPKGESAADFLVRRLRAPSPPVRILALGPLTNLAEAFQRVPGSVRAIREIVVMGGAIHVPGNLGDGGYFKTDNKTAEWNIFVDPLAAQIVFASGAPIRLIPLDATNRVPIDLEFLKEIEVDARSPLGQFVAQVLGSERKSIAQGFYCAWDPLAAVALVYPSVVTASPLCLEIKQTPLDSGRTVVAVGCKANAQVALDARASAFHRIFLDAFSSGRP